MSKDAFYFSHDANAQSDPKILRLLAKHSWYGYGLFWALVEMLRNEESFKLRTDYETYAFALRTDSERIKSVVEDFELFVVEDGFFWSVSLLRRMIMRTEKSEKARESAFIRWEKVKNDANALRTQSECNAIKGNKIERKEKEIEDIVETKPRPKINIPFSEIVSFLNEKADTDYKPNTQSTKSNIRARWAEGFRLEDFKAVIEHKVDAWKTDDKMCKYLRPITIFGTKFESYLQSSKSNINNGYY